MIAKLIDSDCKFDLVSGGLAWAPHNWIGNLSLSWFWFGVNRSLGRARYFSQHKKIPVYLILKSLRKYNS